jgi:hypothetical protein
MYIVVAATFFAVFVFGCPSRALFHIPCPGCGMTRAFVSAFRLDFQMAFLYHPLFPVFALIPIVLILHVLLFFRRGQGANLPVTGANLNRAVGVFFQNKVIFALLIGTFVGLIALYMVRVVLPLIHLADPFFLQLLDRE